MLLRTSLSIPGLKFLSKVDNLDGLQNVDSIITLCDGVIISRLDLGQHIDMNKVNIY